MIFEQNKAVMEIDMTYIINIYGNERINDKVNSITLCSGNDETQPLLCDYINSCCIKNIQMIYYKKAGKTNCRFTRDIPSMFYRNMILFDDIYDLKSFLGKKIVVTLQSSNECCRKGCKINHKDVHTCCLHGCKIGSFCMVKERYIMPVSVRVDYCI